MSWSLPGFMTATRPGNRGVLQPVQPRRDRYLDATGAFHVLVVGGDDVNTPTKKHTGVFYY